MEELFRKIDQSMFGCPHQSFLVNFLHIDSLKGYDIFIDNGDLIPLSQKRTVEFKRKYSGRYLLYDLIERRGFVFYFLQHSFPLCCQYLRLQEHLAISWRRYMDEKINIQQESIFCYGHFLLWDIF